jgi:hypothetical protein
LLLRTPSAFQSRISGAAGGDSECRALSPNTFLVSTTASLNSKIIVLKDFVHIIKIPFKLVRRIMHHNPENTTSPGFTSNQIFGAQS